MAITGARPINKQIMAHLIVPDVDTAVDFYIRAFGARELFHTTHADTGKRHHAQLAIGESTLAVTGENLARPGRTVRSPDTFGGNSALFELYVDDVDAWVERALSAGAVLHGKPPQDMFFGDRYCQVIDPMGHLWAFSTPKTSITAEECDRVMHTFHKQVDYKYVPKASARG